MTTKVLSRESDGDLTTTTYFDEAQGKCFVDRSQDVEEHVKRVARQAEYWNSFDRRNHEMYYAGSYPKTVVEDYCKAKGIKFRDFVIDPSHVRALMQDPNYGVFRVWKGKV